MKKFLFSYFCGVRHFWKNRNAWIPAFSGIIKKIAYLIAIFSIISISYAENLSQNSPLKPLTVILDWFINPDHAPIFVAEQQGYFKAAGLHVTIIPPSNGTDGLKLVLAGKADITIDYGSELPEQQKENIPLVQVGTLINIPLGCVMVLSNSSIKNVADLKNKKIGVTAGFNNIMLNTMLTFNHIKLTDVQLIQLNQDAVQMLLAGKIDAYSGAMRNFEPIEMALAGHPAHLFLPEQNGVAPYSELIFVTNKNNVNNPEIKKFIQAVYQGAAYLKQHPQQTWELFAKTHPELNNPLNHQAWLASTAYFESN